MWGERGLWRPKPLEEVIKEIKQVKGLGAKLVLFADEEFIGPGIEGIRRARSIAQAIIDANLDMEFFINVRADAVYNEDDAEAERGEREETCRLLKKAGFKRIFLGIESGSKTQLRRFGKGSSIEESENAIKFLRSLGVDLTIGFIMFDPLETKKELQENIDFIKRNKILPDMSDPFNVMRVLMSTRYPELVRMEEERSGREILGEFNIDTLCYEILSYRYKDVNIIVNFIKRYLDGYTAFYWNLKQKSRFLEPGFANRLKNYMDEFKWIELDLIADLAKLSDGDLSKPAKGERLLKEALLRRGELIEQLLSEIESEGFMESCSEVIREGKVSLERLRLPGSGRAVLPDMISRIDSAA